jgi:hypothetical protein
VRETSRRGFSAGGSGLEKLLLIADVIGDEIIVRALGFYAAYAKPR